MAGSRIGRLELQLRQRVVALRADATGLRQDAIESTRQQCECAGGNGHARRAGVSETVMGAVASNEEQLRDQIGSDSVVGRVIQWVLRSRVVVVVRQAKRAASRKKRLGMTRGRERRRLEGNKSPVIRVRPRHRPVDPVTQSTYWPRLGAPDGGRSTWAQVQLYSGLPSGARAAGQGVGGSDLDLA